MVSQTAPVLEFLARNGYSALFAVVAAEQMGAPIPAVPVLLGVGALAGFGRYDLLTSLAVAVAACVIPDFIWYLIGRRKGSGVLRLLCRVSMEPDSCVSNSRYWFRRLGASLLLFAKFVPGLSTMAPPMSAISGLPAWRFLLFDGLGSTVWAGLFLVLGFQFRAQLELVAGYAGRTGMSLVAAAALWAAYKWFQRWRFLRSIKVARVRPEDLMERMKEPGGVVVVDLRHAAEVDGDSRKIAGATWLDRGRLQEMAAKIPKDRDVILYCT